MRRSTHTDINVSFDSNNFVDGNGNIKPYSFAEAIDDECEFAYIQEDDTLYRHIGPCWKPGAEFAVEQIARETFEDSICRKALHEVQRNLAVVTRSTRKELLDLPPHELVVSNGVVDLRTGEFSRGWDTPGTLTWLDVEYDPDAGCPHFETFLFDVLHPDDVARFWEVIGYCLYRGYPFQRAFLLLGEGANGKSTLLNAVTRFLGEENVSAVDLHDITGNRFAAANLRGKLANISSDTGGRKLTATDTLKALTGEDMIQADKKYEQPVEFKNTATMLFPANRMPETPDETDAYRRRWLYFEFPNTFEGDDAVPQRQLLDEFEAEHSGILAEAVNAFTRLWKRGKFEETAFMTRYGDDAHEAATDPVVAFAKDNLDFNGVSSVRVSEAYEAYCETTNEPVDQRVFMKRIERQLEVNRQPAPDDGRARVWPGIRLAE